MKTTWRSALGSLVTVLALFALPQVCLAYVECAVTPTRVYVGDGGSLWAVWQEGGAGILSASDPDFNPTLALITSAILTGKSMVVRYADGTACNAQPVTIVGIWLSR
jgi:hypothetical protein